MATRDNRHPGQLPPGQLPPRKISICHLGQSPPRTTATWTATTRTIST